MTLLTKSLLTVAALLVVTGCRNTTPMTSTSSTLSPMQGAAALSPVPGISNTGASTRVPPPPTGSYSPPGSYGTSSTFGTPPASTFAPSASQPLGMQMGGNGMTGGVTSLTPGIPPTMGSVPTGAGSVPTMSSGSVPTGISQAGWVGQSGTAAPMAAPIPATQPPPAPVLGPRSGGMQVIDLTGNANPPGYAPPPNQPIPAMTPQPIPYAPLAPQPASTPLPPAQSSNSTFVNSSSSAPGTTSFQAAPTMRTASRPSETVLPTTEPYPTQAFPAQPTQATADAANQPLQWRRPSPQF